MLKIKKCLMLRSTSLQPGSDGRQCNDAYSNTHRTRSARSIITALVASPFCRKRGVASVSGCKHLSPWVRMDGRRWDSGVEQYYNVKKSMEIIVDVLGEHDDASEWPRKTKH